MTGRHLWFGVIVVLALVTVLGFTALAQETEAPGGKADKPTQEKPKAEKDESAEKAEEEKPTLEKRLVTLHKALEQYMKERRNRVPRTIDTLARFVKEKNQGIINPETGKKLLLNPALAGQFIAKVDKPELLITIYADKDTPGKGRAVVFADGKVKYLAKKGELERTLKQYQPRTLDPSERGPQTMDKAGPRSR